MTSLRSYRELIVWQKSMALVETIYRWFVAIAERRDLWDALTVDAGGGVDSSQHRRGFRRDMGQGSFFNS